MRILIVGNLIKDVYLNLDAKQNSFETDENGTPWMDVAFNGGHQSYFSRTSVFGGANVTLEVFKKLGLEATISRPSDETLADSYRYILCADDKISYFVPSERKVTRFVAPNNPVDWIFVDRSAEIDEELVSKIKNYIGLTRAKLAFFAATKKYDEMSAETRSAARELVRVSNVVFSDDVLKEAHPGGVNCLILDNEIRCGEFIRRYRVSKNDLLTHLTSYSIIAATIFGTMVSGASTKDALELASINVENSKVTGTLSKDALIEKLNAHKDQDGNLRLIAKSLVSPGKGILAADESGGSIHKKFEEAGIPDDETHRRDYRNIFFTTHHLSDYVNGVILFDETARQLSDKGSDFVSYLTSLGIIPGIKVDLGLEPFSEPEYMSENWTKGLSDLPERLAEYYEMGARFAKWRAAFNVELSGVGESEVSIKTPSTFAILKNCEILAEYARDCQNAGIVPIVEPEVVHDGYYSVETCAKITGQILDTLFEQLKRFNVNIEGCLLKVNMVLAGKKFENQSSPEEVGYWTAKVLREHCPRELAGVVFLSGGQGVEQATENLQAVTNNGPFPWPVTFSFARALQGPALDAWKGDNNNADDAREAFYRRLVANCKALRKNDLS